jgi:hypothetical protein
VLRELVTIPKLFAFRGKPPELMIPTCSEHLDDLHSIDYAINDAHYQQLQLEYPGSSLSANTGTLKCIQMAACISDLLGAVGNDSA